MAEDFQIELQELGLLPAEAQVYLALTRNGALSGSALASVTGFPRSSVYHALNSLLAKGLVEGGAGHGSRFSLVPPEQALPALVLQEKEAVFHREKLATQLGQRLAAFVDSADILPEEFIQVIGSRRGAAERFDRLQRNAQRVIEVFVKPPFFAPKGNPGEAKVLRRGVVNKALYERSVLDLPEVKQYLPQWLSAGEEARVYDGDLPHKLVMFDRRSVLAHLRMPGGKMRTLHIQHAELVATLAIAFEALWNQSEPLTLGSPATRKQSKKSHTATEPVDVKVTGRNGNMRKCHKTLAERSPSQLLTSERLRKPELSLALAGRLSKQPRKTP